MKTKVLEGDDLRRILMGAVTRLGAERGAVDALNVFPVPDGDTGTNMYYTLLSASKEVEKLKGDSLSVSAVVDAAALGALMGARGNSGVILSQLLRGFATGLKGKAVMDIHDLEIALKTAVDTAYKAVMKPVEGTILTVAREAVQAGMERIKAGTADILEVLKVAFREGENSLKRTPEKLAVLREAGVVDAGGKGLLVAAMGALDVLQKGELIVAPREELEEAGPSTQEEFERSAISTANVVYRYCTEYIIKPNGKDIDLERVREDLAPHGDSLLVVGSSDMVRIHIHTNNPGVILEYGLLLGELSQIKIDNMAEETDDFFKGREKREDKKGLGVIAVASGDGFKEIFMSLGVDLVVEGGQTMNPSAESFVKAIEEVNAREVILLPNNRNVILTTQQVKTLTPAKVEVVPTKSVVEGIAALMALDRELHLQENVKAMTAGMKGIKSGEVTYAVRDWEANGVSVKKGDYIGLCDNKLRSFGPNRDEVLLSLIKEMLSPEDEVITVYFGSEVTEEEVEKVKERLRDEVEENGISVEFYRGGQPLYSYIVGIE